jgi:excisionase family DNA binding protein
VTDNLVTIDEAATITGMSRRALEGRIARGSLPAEKRGRRLLIDRGELERQRLIPQRPEASKDAVISELLDRLERQAEEIAELKAKLRGVKPRGR